MPKINLESMGSPENREEFRKMLKSGKFSRIWDTDNPKRFREIPDSGKSPENVGIPENQRKPHGHLETGKFLEKSWAVWKMQAFRKIPENPLAVWKIQASRRIAGKSDEVWKI